MGSAENVMPLPPEAAEVAEPAEPKKAEKSGKKGLILVMALYVLVTFITGLFHEPWYDEAQAWQIARCASLHDIIFKVPHYEGHPPFWHLILAVFAKSGMPYELSLTIANEIFAAAAVWVLLFKTKLPYKLKVLLPFTYFMCYQYGVVSRPYAMTALGFMLCAACYNKKNEHPMKMVLSLMVLCASSAYGIAYAFFICIVWLIELMRGKTFGQFLKDFLKSSAFRCLLLLLVFAGAMALMITPAKDSLVAMNQGFTDYAGNIFYAYLLLPFEATIGQIIIVDMRVRITIGWKLIPYVLVSLAIYAAIFFMLKTYKKLLLLIPMAFMPALFGAIFFYSHHMGLFTMYLFFLMCVCFDGAEPEDVNKRMRAIYMGMIYITAAVQIYWTGLSVIMDIAKPYCFGRALAGYIKENGLENKRIISSPVVAHRNPDNMDEYQYDFNVSAFPVDTLPYLDRNIYPNFNITTENEGYVLDIYYTNAELAEQTRQIAALGRPEYMVGVVEGCDPANINENGELDFIYDGAKVEVVYDVEYGGIFKGNYVKRYAEIFKIDEVNFNGKTSETETDSGQLS